MTNDKPMLKLEERTLVGHKSARLRRDGYTPGVLYGKGVDSIAVQAPELDVVKAVKQVGKRQPLQIEIGGKKRTAIIKAISRHPAKGTILNIEFHAIKQNEKITTEVPIVLEGVGESDAEKAGLVVLQTLEKLEVKALPKNLPEQLTVSIAGLTEAGQHVTIADIDVPEGVELEVTDPEAVVASAYEPAALQAANDAAGGDAEEEVPEEETIDDDGTTSAEGASASEEKASS